MGRELSVFRRLEKIEKEIGYCGIKLEREQRLRIQLELMRRHRASLDRTIRSEADRLAASDTDGRCIEGLSLLEIMNRCSFGVSSLEEMEHIRSGFVRLGIHGSLLLERSFIDTEIELFVERLQAYPAFHGKIATLLHDRNGFLSTHQLDQCPDLREMSNEFETIEDQWNHSTEDRCNLDLAVEHAAASADYLRSAIEFMRQARSTFDIEPWIRSGYLLDLFKHSGVGRAKEMVEGSDRNAKLIIREIVCVEERPFCLEGFEGRLRPFLEALFEDLFVRRRIEGTVDLLEEKLETHAKAAANVAQQRDAIVKRQEVLDEQRGRLFQEIGNGRRKLSASA